MIRYSKIQTSESLLVGSILAIVGGYLDTYSYICRGGVFANAETGNIVLFSISLATMEWAAALKYLVPIVAFAIGIIISVDLKAKRDAIDMVHWRQITVFIEIIMLGLIAFVPVEYNFIANSIISLCCGIQVAAFAKFHDNAMATTMCTGNLKSGMQNLHKYKITNEKEYLKKSILYFGCIGWFIVGAMIGGRVVGSMGLKSVLLAPAGLFLVLILMYKESIKEKHWKV